MSQASATIFLVIGSVVDDDEATARSLIGHMAAATLRRPISCSNVAAPTRPSRDLGDSSVSPGRRMSRPGVQGNDVIKDATGPTSVIRSLDPKGPGPCCSGDATGWSGPRVSPPWTGPAAQAHRLDHGGRLGAYSTMSATPFSAIPVAETSVLLVARRPTSPSSWPAVPPLGCVVAATTAWRPASQHLWFSDSLAARTPVFPGGLSLTFSGQITVYGWATGVVGGLALRPHLDSVPIREPSHTLACP